MTTTGTVSFAPATSDLVINALSRIQITGSAITTEHLVRAATEANLALVKIGNRQPNLWTSELGSQVLSQGTATYTLASTVVDITIIYMTTTVNGVSTDRVLGPLSTVEYASLPNKTVQGVVTSFWFDRLITPQITVWPVPDGNATYTLKYRYLRQTYDAGLRSGTTPDMPYRWWDAYCDELTARLARHFKPQEYGTHKAIADESWMIAASEDVENVALVVSPGLSGYFK